MSNIELIEFAEIVRRTCGKSLARIGLGHQDDAIQMISDLCGKAEAIVHGAKMTEEVANPERYDLESLRVDLRNPDSETGDD